MTSLIRSPLRNSPFSVINSNVYDNIFDQLEKNFEDVFAFNKEIFGKNSSIPYDVISLKDKDGAECGLEIRYALAEYNKNDINIEIEGDIISLKVNKSEEEENNKENYLYKGIKRSNWQVSYKLGENVDKEKIKALFKNGCLKLTIPYLEEKEMKKDKIKIEIN